MTYGTQLVITKMAKFMAVQMAQEPLKTALENSNALYRAHKPPLVAFAPIVASTHARDVSFTVGCVPSVDGLRYQVLHLVLPAYTGNLTFKVESGRGDPTAWTLLAGPTVQPTVVGTWIAYQHTVTIANTEDRLRFSYTAPGGVFLVSQVLVWPDPDPALAPLVAPYSQRPSGFWPADDSLLGVAGAPVHTEMLDRCLRNSVAVLRDRWQAVASFVQDDGQYGGVRHQAPFGTVPAGQWALVGKCRAVLPYQLSAAMGGNDMRPVLKVMAKGWVSAGATADRIRVIARGPAGKEDQVLLACDATMQVSTVKAELDGSADAGVDFEFYVRANAGQQVNLSSAVVLWRPGD